MSYQPSWNNDFDFECLYVPSWLNDFDFPYLGCDNIVGEIDISHGEQIAVAISSSNECLIYHGSTATVELTQTTIPWEVVAFAGEDVGYRLSLTYNVAAPQASGEQIQLDLKTTSFVYLFSNSWHGDYAAVNITRQQYLAPTIYDGEMTSVGMRFSVADGMNVSAYHGDIVAADLNFDGVSFKSNIAAGESVGIPELKTLPSVDLPTLNTLDGSQTTANLAMALLFNPTSTGGEIVAADMDIVKGGNQWHSTFGDQTSVSLSTHYNVGVVCLGGERVVMDLTTRDPIHIAATAYDGHGWYATMYHLYSAPLFPYPIVNDSWMDVAIGPHWLHFHTCRSCKLPIHAWNFHIRLERYEDVRLQHSAEIGTATAIELTTEIYPEIVSFGGEFVSVSMDTVMETEPNKMFDGSGIYPFFLTTSERTDTDHTNPRPDGNEIITDNGSPEQRPEHFWSMRGGEYGIVLLSAERHPEASLTDGARVEWDLTIDKPWEVQFWSGERIWPGLSTTVRLDSNISHGDNVEARFEEPEWHITHGEQVEVRIKLTYDVEWQETGCLDNEIETTTTIEQEPFRHSLKARCL